MEKLDKLEQEALKNHYDLVTLDGRNCLYCIMHLGHGLPSLIFRKVIDRKEELGRSVSIIRTGTQAPEKTYIIISKGEKQRRFELTSYVYVEYELEPNQENKE